VTEKTSFGIRLLDREVPEESLRERTAHVAAPRNLIRKGTKSIVVFRLGVEWFGLATEVFQEALEEWTVHTLPHRRGGMLEGLVNVRGELLLCVSLGNLLGPGPAPELKGTRPPLKETGAKRLRPHLLVCSRGGDRLAFVVSEVFGIHRYHPEDLRDAPATLTNAAAGAYTIGLVPWNARTVGCLDHELIFNALTRGLA
jgi:chemotaxis-related protein WspD